jgi:prophage antirepressor-like protein
MSEVLIYEENGKIAVDVLLENETLWLSLNQITELFERDKSVISRHLKKIFIDGELDPLSVVANYATTGSDGKIYQVDHYNLDAIISVGYRVNSKRGTLFRQWANSVLKNYLLDGYALNQKKLLSKGFSDLEKSISLLSRTISQQEQTSDISQEAIRIIEQYARSWKILVQFDEKNLKLPDVGHTDRKSLPYEICVSCIADLKSQLMAKKEASDIFGNERARGLESILGNTRPLLPSRYTLRQKKLPRICYISSSRITRSRMAISASAVFYSCCILN